MALLSLALSFEAEGNLSARHTEIFAPQPRTDLRYDETEYEAMDYGGDVQLDGVEPDWNRA